PRRVGGCAARWSDSTGLRGKPRGDCFLRRLRTGSRGGPMMRSDGICARTLVKAGLARALFWTGTDALLGALLDPPWTPVVLGYHRVVPDFRVEARQTIAAMLIAPRMLEQQLDWIGRRYRFVSLDELGQRLERDGDAAGRLVAVTFDD